MQECTFRTSHTALLLLSGTYMALRRLRITPPTMFGLEFVVKRFTGNCSKFHKSMQGCRYESYPWTANVTLNQVLICLA